MTIVVGCDNAAVDLKNTLIACLKEQGVTVEDEGCMDASDPTVYPLVAKRVCENIIRSGYAKRGVLVCGTGIGMALAADKVKGIRAAVCHDPFSTERSRKSNDAQIMCMGARVIGPELAKMLVKLWLTCDFAGGGSAPKVEAIKQMEEKYFK